MKVPLNWLNKHIKIDDLDQDKFIHQFATQIVDVEGIDNAGEGIKDIVVGKILEVKKHENSDHLWVTKVDVGGEVLQIVTGAPNVSEASIGKYSPVVKSGTTLPDGLKVEKRDLRGVESNGMMCSLRELGLGDDHSGILLLDEYLTDGVKDLKPGQKLVDVLNLNEKVLDLDNKIITNRAYCFGLRGLAKEVSVLLDRDLNDLKLAEAEVIGSKTDEVEIVIENTEVCWRISGAIIKDLTLGTSPSWMQQALLSIGSRPISNIVDITNYVMFDLGHPMHAFDLDKIATDKDGVKRVTARLAKKGEKLTTLDGKERILSEEDYIFVDASGPIGLGGVMGGLNSEISEETKNIFMVAERFDPINIRKTAKRHGLPSEAATRFEKGVDPNNTVAVLQHAANLVKELASGKFDGKIIDNYPVKLEPWTLEFDINRVEKLVGLKVTEQFIERVFSRFDIEILDKKGSVWSLKIPTYRADVKIREDLIEDIGRMYGYDNLKATVPTGAIEPPTIDPLLGYEQEAIRKIAQLGYSEIKTPTFVSNDFYKKLGLEEISEKLKLINPSSPEYEYLRPSLVPSLVMSAITNLKNYNYFRIFEADKTYAPSKTEGSPKDNYESGRPLEFKTLSGLLASTGEAESLEETALRAKGDLEVLLQQNRVKNVKFKKAEKTSGIYQPNTQIAVYSGDQLLGNFGILNTLNLEEVGITGGILVVFELDVESMLKSSKKLVEFKKYSKYPAVKQDFTFDIAKDMTVGEAEEILKDYKADILAEWELYDIYEDDSRKSISIHVKWQSMKRTLVEKEITDAVAEFTKAMSDKGLKIRG